MMRAKWMGIGLLAVSVAALSGCLFLPATVTLAAGDEGTIVTINVGDTLVVRLSGNPTTGFSWVRTEPQNQTILEPVGDPEYTPDDPDVCGGGGTFRFTFRAVGAGTTPLSFDYKRPWEEAVLGTYAVTVYVP
jgi:inhibitor of cysteine peptidase